VYKSCGGGNLPFSSKDGVIVDAVGALDPERPLKFSLIPRYGSANTLMSPPQNAWNDALYTIQSVK